MHLSPYVPAKMLSEVGEEKRCMACGEYWPADSEFFQVMRSSSDGLSPRCRACVKERLWAYTRRHSGN